VPSPGSRSSPAERAASQPVVLKQPVRQLELVHGHHPPSEKEIPSGRSPTPSSGGGAGVDGVNVIYISLPGTYADFIEHAPVLHDRGLMQREYRPGTLREKLFPGRGPRLPERHPARRVTTIAQAG
jgi:hypothetical protein